MFLGFFWPPVALSGPVPGRGGQGSLGRSPSSSRPRTQRLGGTLAFASDFLPCGLRAGHRHGPAAEGRGVPTSAGKWIDDGRVGEVTGNYD